MCTNIVPICLYMSIISKLGDYALVIMHELARNNPASLSANAISLSTKVNPPTAMKILKTLCKHKLVASTRGVKGGYQLSRDPSNINLLEIITAVEGEVHAVACAKGQHCHLSSHCKVQHMLCKVSNVWQSTLSTVRLSDFT